MSKGIYTILEQMNSGEDALLVATSMLTSRLNRIYRNGIDSRLPNPTPLISDVLKTHGMYMVCEYKPHVAVAYEYIKTSKEGGGMTLLHRNGSNTNRSRFCLKGNNGNFIGDMVIHVRMQPLGDATADNTATHFAYCDYPGVRMPSRIALNVDNVVVDEYTSVASMLEQKIDISVDKFASWQKNVGQETTYEGTSYNRDLQTTQVIGFRDGAQTPRTYQQPLDLWIPLRFWFNMHVEMSIHNSMLTTDDKYIEVDFENVSKLVRAYDENLNPIANYFDTQSVRIDVLELYTRNIYINPEINDLIARRQLVNVIRIHRQQSQIINTTSGRVLFSQLKYPIEHFSFGFMPVENDNSLTRWHQFGRVTDREFPVPAVVIDNLLPPPYLKLVINTATYSVVNSVVDKLGLSVYGNVVYSDIDEAFYNAYLGYITPDSNLGYSPGVYMINMSHLRNGIDLNGYINNSQTREVYLSYTANALTPSYPATFTIVARCINFLLYSNGSIRLKYIT